MKLMATEGEHPRLRRERRTVARLVELYCREQHRRPDGLCPECRELLAYAHLRLSRCPFQENKTTCGNCPIHCYQPAMREKIRTVMRHAGPRLFWRHPLLALGHLLDGFRKRPGPRKKPAGRS